MSTESNTAHLPPHPDNVQGYLRQAYTIPDDAALAAAMAEAETHDDIENGLRSGSHTYYVGDQVARRHGWEENPEYDPDAEEDDE